MEQYAGIDVSLEFSSVCIVDAGGKVIREAKAASEPSALIEWFAAQDIVIARIGLEAGPLSRWLYAEMKAAGLAVELLETRHVRDAFKAMPVKTDRKGRWWHRPPYATGLVSSGSLQVATSPGKSLPAQEGASAADNARAAAA